MVLSAMTVGAAVGIAVGIIALFGLAAGITLFALKKSPAKRPMQPTPAVRHINPEHDNTKLFERIKLDGAAAGTTVIVPPTHAAIVLKNGSFSDVLSAGEFPLVSSGEVVHSLEVLFVSKTLWVTVRWGTQSHNRFDYVDPKIGKPVSVGAFGEMQIRVTNPRLFYLELVSSCGSAFSVDDLQNGIRRMTIDATVRELLSALTKNKVSYIDFTAAKFAIQDQIKVKLSEKFDSEFGFEVRDFIIENINIPDEQEREIRRVYDFSEKQDELYELERKDAKRRKRDAVEDFDLDDELYRRKRDREREEYEYARTAQTLARDEQLRAEERAREREDKARDADMRLKEKVIDAMRDVEVTRAKAQTPASPHVEVHVTNNSRDTVECPFCHATLPRGTIYCPYCGGQIKK